MVENLVTDVSLFLERFFSPELIVFLMSMLPISELRGGLIAAALWQIPWQVATPIAVLGNCLPIPFILLFIRRVLDWMEQTKLFSRLASHFKRRADRKSGELMQKHPASVKLGLFLFVAVPLPMTGAWTGALIAAFLKMKPKDSLPSILGGVAAAAVIMLVITYLIPALIAGA